MRQEIAGCKSHLGVGPLALLLAAVDALGPALRQRRRRPPKRAASNQTLRSRLQTVSHRLTHTNPTPAEPS